MEASGFKGVEPRVLGFRVLGLGSWGLGVLGPRVFGVSGLQGFRLRVFTGL